MDIGDYSAPWATGALLAAAGRGEAEDAEIRALAGVARSEGPWPTDPPLPVARG